MRSNPILEEVWRVKDQLAAESGYDVDRFFEQLRDWSAAHPYAGRVIRTTEELQELMAEKERARARQSPMALNEERPPKP